MTANKRVLRPIDQNRRKPHQELRPVDRSKIITCRKEKNMTMQKIADKLHVPLSTVNNTIKLEDSRVDNESRPRSGRPRAYSEADERVILRAIKMNPNITSYEELKFEAGVDPSIRTYQRILKDNGYAKGYRHGTFHVKPTTSDT